MAGSAKFAASVTQNPSRDWKKCEINGSFTMMGYSRAADRTFFSIPELKLGLDAGGCRGRQPDFVFVTHSHIDHSADLWYLAQNEASTIFLPAECIPFASANILASWELNLCEKINVDPSSLPLKAAIPGETYAWGKQDKYRVKVFSCIHKVPTVGYAVYEPRSKLKEEYKGKPGKEIGALRKAGVEITQDYHHNMFVYMGDTSAVVYDRNPWLFEYPTIITECTFFLDEHERAERDGHIHWDALMPHVIAHPNTEFILIHFSLRYKVHEVHEFFERLTTREENPLHLANVTILVGDGTMGKQ